jgi:hypothetical protein
MIEELAGVALKEPKDSVLARGPEEGDIVAEARQQTKGGTIGNHGGMLAHRG